MDTLAMHRRLTGAGFDDRQADAIIDTMTGGIVTKLDLELQGTQIAGSMAALDARLSGQIEALDARLSARIDALDARLSARIDKLDQKLTLGLWGVGIAVVAPLITRLVLG